MMDLAGSYINSTHIFAFTSEELLAGVSYRVLIIFLFGTSPM